MAITNSLNNRSSALNINGVYSLPIVDGTNSQIMTTNGSGVITWTDNIPGTIAQTLNASTNSVVHITGNYTVSNTIPTITGGTHLLTVNITPKSASNVLYIAWNWGGSSSIGNLNAVTALFLGGATNTFYASSIGNGAGGDGDCYSSGIITVVAGTTSPTSIELRIGVDVHSLYVNGTGSGTGLYGGFSIATLTVQEIRI